MKTSPRFLLTVASWFGLNSESEVPLDILPELEVIYNKVVENEQDGNALIRDFGRIFQIYRSKGVEYAAEVAVEQLQSRYTYLKGE